MASTLLPDPSDGFSQFLPTTLDDVAGAMTGEAPENMNSTTVPVDTPEAVTPEVVAQEAEELEAAAETPATIAGGGSSVLTEEETSLPEVMNSTALPKDYLNLFEDQMRRSDQERARREQEKWDKWTVKHTEENDKMLLDGDKEWKNINHSYEPDQKPKLIGKSRHTGCDVPAESLQQIRGGRGTYDADGGQ